MQHVRGRVLVVIVHTFLRRIRSPILAMCAVLAVFALTNCGGGGGTSIGASPSPTPTPAPFTGKFAGSAALDAGRTGNVSLDVQNDETATGTLVITGGATTETVPLSGFVALSDGDFSLSGSSGDGLVTATVSGTLPASSSTTGILVIQIGTSFFRGTISAA